MRRNPWSRNPTAEDLELRIRSSGESTSAQKVDLISDEILQNQRDLYQRQSFQGGRGDERGEADSEAESTASIRMG